MLLEKGKLSDLLRLRRRVKLGAGNWSIRSAIKQQQVVKNEDEQLFISQTQLAWQQ